MVLAYRGAARTGEPLTARVLVNGYIKGPRARLCLRCPRLTLKLLQRGDDMRPVAVPPKAQSVVQGWDSSSKVCQALGMSEIIPTR